MLKSSLFSNFKTDRIQLGVSYDILENLDAISIGKSSFTLPREELQQLFGEPEKCVQVGYSSIDLEDSGIFIFFILKFTILSFNIHVFFFQMSQLLLLHFIQLIAPVVNGLIIPSYCSSFLISSFKIIIQEENSCSPLKHCFFNCCALQKR